MLIVDFLQLLYRLSCFAHQISSDDSQSRQVIVSGSIHPVAPASPPTDQHSPVRPQSPAFHSVEECNTDGSVQFSRQHQDDGLILDVSCIKVCGYQKKPEPRMKFTNLKH